MRKTTKALMFLGALATLSARAHDVNHVAGAPPNDSSRADYAAIPAVDEASSSAYGRIDGHVERSDDLALGWLVSDVRRMHGLDEEVGRTGYFRYGAPIHSEVFTLAYIWRNLKLEASSFSARESGREQGAATLPVFESAAGRLSYSPSPNWTLRFSRGYQSALDQLDPDGNVRRTVISAVYKRSFSDGDWQSTFAWGRNTRTFRESTNGYLMESVLRLANVHAVFGRVEQVGDDDLPGTNERQHHVFKLNKLTVGYFYNVPSDGPIRYDVGGLISRHLVPSGMAPTYGGDPTSFLMFVRFKLR